MCRVSGARRRGDSFRLSHCESFCGTSHREIDIPATMIRTIERNSCGTWRNEKRKGVSDTRTQSNDTSDVASLPKNIINTVKA